MHLSPESSRAVLDLARSAIRSSLLRQPFVAAAPCDELSQPAGCFVSLHDLTSHRLRGCVGQLESTDPLSKVVPQVAESCLHDPRFAYHRVQANELSGIQIEVTVLSPLRPAADLMDFDLLAEGIVLRMGEQSACFLPQVARETGWSKEQMLSRLCTEKLCVPADGWRSPEARLQKFTALILGPEPFETYA